MEDEGFYKCMTEEHIISSILLKVKGCDLVENTVSTTVVTGYSGESVVLPCFCTELLAKPEKIQWMMYLENTYEEIYPNEKIESHKDRVKLLNQTTPGNLSLHISALAAEHGGVYTCSVSSKRVSYILHVEDVFIVLAVILSVPLLALLPFIYWRYRGGRNVKKMTSDEEELNGEQDNRDDVMYSAVVHVKTASTPAQIESNPAEHTEYASVKVKR
ncbi:hypothetical protein R3I94_015138 [Phoxinus phoxinus]